MSETKSTPAPWHYEPGDSGDPSVGIGPTHPFVWAGDEDNPVTVCGLHAPAYRVEPVDEWDEGLREYGTAEGNGELIVRAVNSFAGLLAACDALLRCAELGERPALDGPQVAAARAAVARARGQS